MKKRRKEPAALLVLRLATYGVRWMKGPYVFSVLFGRDSYISEMYTVESSVLKRGFSVREREREGLLVMRKKVDFEGNLMGCSLS